MLNLTKILESRQNKFLQDLTSLLFVWRWQSYSTNHVNEGNDQQVRQV